MPRGYNIDKLNRKELIAIARYNTKLINESFKALQGWNEKETIDYIKEKNSMFAGLTKTKNIDRYKNIRVASGNLSRMNKKQIRKIIYKQELYLNSKWSSPEGREEIFEKQYQTLKNTYMGLTRENVKRYLSENPEIMRELEAKIRNAKVLGIPYIAIMGNNTEDGYVEIERTRDGAKKTVKVDELLDLVEKMKKEKKDIEF